MKQRISRASSIRAAALVAMGALLAVAALGSTATAATITMKGPKGGIRFEGPKTIVAGEELKVVNQSNPKQIGPHTFSLVPRLHCRRPRKHAAPASPQATSAGRSRSGMGSKATGR